jgi:hypothetical protein
VPLLLEAGAGAVAAPYEDDAIYMLGLTASVLNGRSCCRSFRAQSVELPGGRHYGPRAIATAGSGFLRDSGTARDEVADVGLRSASARG